MGIAFRRMNNNSNIRMNVGNAAAAAAMVDDIVAVVVTKRS